MNITDPIRRCARIDPDAPAVVRPDGVSVSYRDLDRTIDAVAGRIATYGIGPGTVAGTAIVGPYRSVVLALALARLGAAAAPASLPAAHMTACFVDPGAQIEGNPKCVPLEGAWPQVPPPEIDVPPVPSHQEGAAPCMIFASSGTTGASKHTVATHDMVTRRILWKFLALRPPASAKQISMVGAGTSYGFPNTLRILWVGGLVVFPRDPATADQLLALVRRFQVNYLLTAPASLAALVAALPHDAGPLPSLQTIEVSGSALPARVFEAARQRLCSNIVSLYGSTEASSIASAPMSSLLGQPGAVGYLHPGVEAEAVDEHDAPLPPGTQGVLRVRSEMCVDAYLDDPASSAAVFKGGWVYPGDLGTVSHDGLVSLAGRAVEVINRGGVKISPQVIEDLLATVPEVKEAAAFGAPDAMGITAIWVAIVPEGAVNIEALKALCNERLGDGTPNYFMQLRELPRNRAGKILRSELARMVAANASSRASA